ncbi:unnamed protein product [Sphagnum compactum]
MHLLNLMPPLHNSLKVQGSTWASSGSLEEGQYHMVWRIWLLHRVGAVTLEEAQGSSHICLHSIVREMLMISARSREARHLLVGQVVLHEDFSLSMYYSIICDSVIPNEAVFWVQVSLENRLGSSLLTVISKQQIYVSATLTKFLVTTNPDEST